MYKLIIVLVCFTLIGCSPVNLQQTAIYETSPTVTPLTSSTRNLADNATSIPKPITTSIRPVIETETSIPQALETIAITDDPGIAKRCAKLVDQFPANVSRKGFLFFSGILSGKPYALNMAQQLKIDLAPILDQGDWMVSPDETLILHRIPLEQPKGAYQYRLYEARGRDLGDIQLEKDWKIWIWLSKNNLVLYKHHDPQLSTYEVAVLDPITKQLQKLPFDYPDLYPFFVGMPYLPNAYDPSLKWVVYPAATDTFTGFILRDVVHKKNMVSVFSNVSITEPKWSPDGKQFVVAGIQGSADTREFEFYKVDLAGKLTQLTHLSSPSSTFMPQKFSWAPDGTKVAFWLWKNGYSNEQIAVLDMETHQVTNYCIGGTGLASEPIWSPDAQQLVLAIPDAEGDEHQVVLDLNRAIAVDLGHEDIMPFWLNALPRIWKRK